MQAGGRGLGKSVDAAATNIGLLVLASATMLNGLRLCSWRERGGGPRVGTRRAERVKQTDACLEQAIRINQGLIILRRRSSICKIGHRVIVFCGANKSGSGSG